MMGRFLILVAAFAVTLSGATFAGVHIINAVGRQTVDDHHLLDEGRQRHPAVRGDQVHAALAKSAPIIVVLGGAAVDHQPTRSPGTEFLPDATADKAELVYPVRDR